MEWQRSGAYALQSASATQNLRSAKPELRLLSRADTVQHGAQATTDPRGHRLLGRASGALHPLATRLHRVRRLQVLNALCKLSSGRRGLLASICRSSRKRNLEVIAKVCERG